MSTHQVYTELFFLSAFLSSPHDASILRHRFNELNLSSSIENPMRGASPSKQTGRKMEALWAGEPYRASHTKLDLLIGSLFS